jgi:hypothetical protein
MQNELTLNRWTQEAGPRVEGSQPLDISKVQAPCIVRNPSGGYRLFYTAIGLAKPYPECQGYILSAVSDDGLVFQKEPGIRLAPQPSLRHASLRVLAPTVTEYDEGCWRMYFEARGPAGTPAVICSAVSSDMLSWEVEDGIRLESPDGLGGPRYLPLPGGGGRLYVCSTELDQSGEKASKPVISAITSDGLLFEVEPGFRIRDKQSDYDSSGITAAEVIQPTIEGSPYTMVYSTWQDVPPGTFVPPHPSGDANASESGDSIDFAAASIASDMAGYRSRIFVAHSTDGLEWGPGECVIDGAGYGGDGIDAVHAEDMSVIQVSEGVYRMYYAACDKDGNWRVASAITTPTDE